MNKWKIIIATISVLCILFTGCGKKTKSVPTTAKETQTTAKTTAKITTTVPTTQPTTAVQNDTALEQVLKKLIPQNNGVWSIYYKNLKTGKVLCSGHNKMVSASLIKLFIMATVYDQIYRGKLQDTAEIESLMERMITVSHNLSSNELVKIVGGGKFSAGMKVVNAYAAKIDCIHTEQQRDMLDSRPVPIPEQNYTCVYDCGRLLEMIYQKKCISPEYDNKMLQYMLRQERTWKIPAGLPQGTKCANKTGELSDTENDVAIVFTPQADYILCVISNDLTSTSQAQQTIQNISAAVYRHVTTNENA